MQIMPEHKNDLNRCTFDIVIEKYCGLVFLTQSVFHISLLVLYADYKTESIAEQCFHIGCVVYILCVIFLC